MKLILLALLLASAPRVDAQDAPDAPAAPAAPAEAAPDFPNTYNPLRLKVLTETPESHLISDDASMSAVAGESAITVWSLPKGKPLFRIAAPVPERAGPTDKIVFAPGDFSHDGRWLVATLDHRRSDEERHWASSEVQIVLVSIPDEKIVKTLTTFDDPCGQDPFKCTTVFSAKFTADGRKVVVSGERGASAAGQYEMFLTALDLDGKRLFDEAQVKVRNPGSEKFVIEKPNHFGLTFVGFAADGRMLGVGRDDGSCALLDMTNNKRLSFLEGCTDRDFPRLRAEHGYLFFAARDKGTLKIWGFDGALRGKVAAEPSESRYALEPVGDGRYALEADGSNIATISARPAEGSYQGALWDTKSHILLAATQEDWLSEAYNVRMTPDRRHIAMPTGGRVLYASVDAGMPLEPSAKPLVTKISVEAPAAGAPARGFDAPPASTAKPDADAFAVIIGVEKYRQAGIPKVDFAARDARTIHAYVTKAMGFDPKNVVLLTDDQATRTDFDKHLGSWLRNRVGAGSRVFVYYAGHGAPNPTTGEGYLMPYEADPNYLEDSAYPVARLYDSLSKLPTKDVTVVLDACFSGQGGRSLLAKGARPLVVAKTASSGANTVVLAAAQGTQISASDPQRRHGLLTSYLLEALHGGADANKDGDITSAEVITFVRPAVERAARLQNLEQTPTMTPSLEELKARPGRPWISLGK